MWSAYAAAFIQADGRVIDEQHDSRYTTSEGQAYSLFFALVADDRDRFDTLLRWTDRHLAQGELGRRLPGWRWGRHDDGQWRLLDANAASDADLWLTHTLFEAARLWQRRELFTLAHALLARIRQDEITLHTGLGPTLLPGPKGFIEGDGTVRLNPSYEVLHQWQALAREDPHGPWAALRDTLPQRMQAMCPVGLAPDWIRHRPGQGWIADAEQAGIGSFDAIRCYLWAGLADARDPRRATLLQALRGMAGRIDARTGHVPMRVDTRPTNRPPASPVPLIRAPAGFSAALLPYCHAIGSSTGPSLQRALEHHLATQWRGVQGPAGTVPASCQAQGARLLQAPASSSAPSSGPSWGPSSAPSPARYYDQVLALFGLGFMQGRFSFDAQGHLWPAWSLRR